MILSPPEPEFRKQPYGQAGSQTCYSDVVGGFLRLGRIFLLDVHRAGEKLLPFLFHSDPFHTAILTALYPHTYPFRFSRDVAVKPLHQVPTLDGQFAFPSSQFRQAWCGLLAGLSVWP